MLRLENVNVFYDEVQVLRDLSIGIKNGEGICLLGNNGSGKTTTVNAISGIIPVKSGKIYFMGEDITNMSTHQRVEMGLVQIPEGRKIFPTLTVEENLLMGSFLKKPKLRRSQSLQMVKDLFPILADRFKQAGGTLSGGEQQMLAIARGLMSIPKLLILDEASLGLAPLVVEEIFKVIEQIRRDGVTVLLVEQNVSQALAISDRGYVIEEGQLALTGVASALIDDPQIKRLYLGMEEIDLNAC
ncbi:MAG: ABC transporter ATP-binding protein [Desulfobacterales bacterium]|nr:ABC transporter ATP-binding protein [Desulfobacterales bacterium]